MYFLNYMMILLRLWSEYQCLILIRELCGACAKPVLKDRTGDVSSERKEEKIHFYRDGLLICITPEAVRVTGSIVIKWQDVSPSVYIIISVLKCNLSELSAWTQPRSQSTEVVCISTRHATVCPNVLHQSDSHMHAFQINSTNAHVYLHPHIFAFENSLSSVLVVIEHGNCALFYHFLF